MLSTNSTTCVGMVGTGMGWVRRALTSVASCAGKAQAVAARLYLVRTTSGLPHYSKLMLAASFATLFPK